jgi:hypothetical protein
MRGVTAASGPAAARQTGAPEGHFMKRILLIAAIVAAVLVAVAIAIPFLLDVNVFRPQLESYLSSALGRQVKVGNLRLSILQQSVRAETISIADDPAFSAEPFVKAKSLAVGVELIPLLTSRKLRVTNLTLESPEIVLLRDVSGRWNYSSLGAGAGSGASAGSGRGAGPKRGGGGASSAEAGGSASAGGAGGGRSAQGGGTGKNREAGANPDAGAKDRTSASQGAHPGQESGAARGAGSKVEGEGAARVASSGFSKQALSIEALAVKNGRVTVGRVGRGGRTRVYAPVDLTVKGFSWTTPFTFSLSAAPPGGGDIRITGSAGPIDPADVSMTRVTAALKVTRIDLAASGLVDPASGIAGLAAVEGTLHADGRQIRLEGSMNAEKLKLVPAGAPAARAVRFTFALEHDRRRQSGTLSRGDLQLGKALARLGGTYSLSEGPARFDLRLAGKGMPVDDVEAVLPAVGIVLPQGSSLEGGSLAVDFTMTGSSTAPVVQGPLRITDTRLAGFDLGSKLSAISALAGVRTGADTTIQNLSADLRATLAGITASNMNLTVEALGALAGAGTVGADKSLDFRMTAHLTGGAVTGLSKLAGLGGKGTSIPFFIRGTCSSPKFVADVQGLLGSRLGAAAGTDAGTGSSSKNIESSAMDMLKGYLDKKGKKPR